MKDKKVIIKARHLSPSPEDWSVSNLIVLENDILFLSTGEHIIESWEENERKKNNHKSTSY